MRNKHLLEKFMEENGIEYNVPFTVERTGFLGEKVQYEFKITKSDDYTGFELSYADSTKQMGDSFVVMQELMFSDKMIIIKKPWKPKEEENFYYIDTNGNTNLGVFTTCSTVDLSKYITGNCFKTTEEAKKHKDDVLRILMGEPLVKWED